MIRARVFDNLDPVKTVRIPQADSSVFTDRDYLLLFVVKEHVNDLFVLMSDDAVDDA